MYRLTILHAKQVFCYTEQMESVANSAGNCPLNERPVSLYQQATTLYSPRHNGRHWFKFGTDAWKREKAMQRIMAQMARDQLGMPQSKQ